MPPPTSTLASPPRGRGPLSGRPHTARIQTLAILLVALVPRLAVLARVAAQAPATPLFDRGLEMGLLARSLVQGHGLSSPFGFPAAQFQTGPTAFIAPGYPILIAAIFRLCGTYSVASELVILNLQIAANLVTVFLILHLARTLPLPAPIAKRTALLAGLLWALSPPLVFMPTIFWDTSLGTMLLTGAVALVLRIRRVPTRGAWLLLGAYSAVAALLNPALLPVLLGLTLWLAWQTRTPARLLLAAFALALVFGPWPLRNARVFHAFIPLRTTVGFELWVGNHPGATGRLDESLFPTFNPHELADYTRLGELAYTAQKSELAHAFLRQHPGTFLHLTALRVARFWLGTGNSGGSLFFPAYAILTSAFGLAGLFLLFRERRRPIAHLFALPLLLFPLPYYITHAEFRYRLALDPLLTLLAAYAFTSLMARRQAAIHPPVPEPIAAERAHA